MLNFLLGAAFIIFGIPIVEQISDLIISLMESWKSKLNITIAANNFKITKMTMDKGKNISAIGFCTNETDEEMEEFGEDDKTHKTIKGFGKHGKK